MSNNSEYPKVMWVSRTPFEEKCSEENKCRRVVFMEKLDGYLAWEYATTIEESLSVTSASYWKYAKDIEEPVGIVKENRVMKTKVEVVRAIPYQLCPKCNGTGQMWLGMWDGQSQSFPTSGMGICDVCSGNKIIPMYQLVQTCNKEESGCYNSNGCNCKS